MRRIVVLLGVPALVALAAAGLAACDDDGGGGGGGKVDPAIEGAPNVEVLGDNLQFDPDEITVQAGDFNVALNSEDVFHDLVIEDVPDGDADGDELVVEANGGDTKTGSATITEPGEYTFYCSVPGHREGGMEGTLTVEES